MEKIPGVELANGLDPELLKGKIEILTKEDEEKAAGEEQQNIELAEGIDPDLPEGKTEILEAISEDKESTTPRQADGV